MAEEKVMQEKVMQEKVMQGTINKYTTAGSSKPKWRYRLRLGRDPITGVYLREGKGGFAKEGEARAAMRDRIAGIAREQNSPVATPPSTEVTLATWLVKWINVFAPRSCERKTLSRYAQLANYITADDAPPEMNTLARTPLASVRRAQFKPALFALLSAKAKRREHLSGRSILHVRGLLSVALNEAVEQELLPANPMAGLKLKGLSPKRGEIARALTSSEIQAARQVCLGDWTFTLVEVALASGARRGELLALQWTDINFATCMLTVSKSLDKLQRVA
jgi:integrase